MPERSRIKILNVGKMRMFNLEYYILKKSFRNKEVNKDIFRGQKTKSIVTNRPTFKTGQRKFSQEKWNDNNLLK